MIFLLWYWCDGDDSFHLLVFLKFVPYHTQTKQVSVPFLIRTLPITNLSFCHGFLTGREERILILREDQVLRWHDEVFLSKTLNHTLVAKQVPHQFMNGCVIVSVNE